MAKSAKNRSTRASKSDTCLGCRESLFTRDYARRERICTACGLVVSERSADRRPEWRAFTAEERDAIALEL